MNSETKGTFTNTGNNETLFVNSQAAVGSRASNAQGTQRHGWDRPWSIVSWAVPGHGDVPSLFLLLVVNARNRTWNTEETSVRFPQSTGSLMN